MPTISSGPASGPLNPGTLVSLMLSDVVGDDLDVTASGPTVADKSTFEECMKIIEKYDIRESVPKAVLVHWLISTEKEGVL